MALAISTIDVIVSAVFTVLVARQWLSSRKTHQLLWTVALFVWTLAVLAETASAIRGRWDPMSYRIYYAFGALMVASWLGAGTLFLVAPRRLAVGFFFVTALLSLAGSALILTHPIDPAQLAQTDALGFVEVKVFPFIPVRILIVISNILGTLAFTGGALYSVWRFVRQGLPRQPMIGVLLIGLGGLVAASAHSIGVLGRPNLFRASELTAVVLIFGGYLLSTRLSARTPSPV
jgi:hypothetical protein